MGTKKENDYQSEKRQDIGQSKTGTMPPKKQVRPQSINEQLQDPDDQRGVKGIMCLKPDQPA
jgi:hypothetical protein